MKLKELKDLIMTDLTIIDGYQTVMNVNKNGKTFKLYENREVIGIRATRGGSVLISIK